MLEHLSKNAGIMNFSSEKIISFIQSLGDDVTFAQGSNNDFSPYQAGIQLLSDRYKIDTEPFIELVR